MLLLNPYSRPVNGDRAPQTCGGAAAILAPHGECVFNFPKARGIP
jgi:hypothetical protein